MAERRMVSLKIIDTDKFLEMPMSTRLLYYDFCARADDDGFIASPNKIAKMVGSSQDDIKVLVAKNFIIPFESGVCVIKDWRIHNYIQNDRYSPTIHKAEKAKLLLDENKAYTLCIQNGYNLDTQERIGKDRLELGKKRKEKCVTAPAVKNFQKPTLEELTAYCVERKNNINPQSFLDFYESKGWKVGNTPMEDWKAAVRTWEQRNNTTKPKVETKNKYGGVR